MASLVVVDHDRNMHSIIVFPTAFAIAYTRLQEGKAFEMEFSKTKEGDLTLKEVVQA